MSSIVLRPGGIHTALLPFPIEEKRALDANNDYECLLGKEFEVQTEDGPVIAKLVRLDNAAGITDPGERVFVWTAELTRDVDIAGTGGAELLAGVTPPGLEDLVDNDVFFVLVGEEGSIVSVEDDGAGAIAAGDYLEASVTTAGQVVSTGAVFTKRESPLVALEAGGGAGVALKAKIVDKLVG